MEKYPEFTRGYLQSLETKPVTLFHASRNKKLDLLEPKDESVRDRSEGKVVFASPAYDYATCFMAGLDDSWTKIMAWGITSPFCVIISDERRFRENDIGGAVYFFKPELFTSDTSRNSRTIEWTSKIAVKSFYKIEYTSSLDAMLGAYVQVFFVSKAVFSDIKTATDKGLSILNTIESENKRQNHNVLEIYSQSGIDDNLAIARFGFNQEYFGS
jgi:hypothetical protein